GSLGLDLETAVAVTVTGNRPQKIPTRVQGPLLINQQACRALLLGRSSSGLRGLFVLPGLINADFQGEICIVAQTLFPPMHIPKGSKIAQLIPMQQLTSAMEPITNQCRGSKGFGSSGSLALLTLDLQERPVVPAVFQCQGEDLHICVLLDPGADVTIV
ncbi:POK9 protein, partial [Oriolus oriolus]|nr:POK9 protein [Oriolus oriolus]